MAAIDSKSHFGEDAQDQRQRGVGNISMPPDLFEKLYLQPQTNVSGNLRSMVGNPTPIGFIGFVVGLTPLACALMGWRGAGEYSTATIGIFFFISGPMLWFAAIMDFFLGNTFPSMVFFIYGGTFFTLGATLQPYFASAAAYGGGDFYTGMASPGFYATLAYFPTCIASLHIIFIIASLRINAIFFGIFVTAALGFYLFASALWLSAEGAANAADVQVAAGAVLFVCAILGWYILAAQILASVNFPISLPVGDFSRFWADTKVVSKDSGDKEAQVQAS